MKNVILDRIKSDYIRKTWGVQDTKRKVEEKKLFCLGHI